MKSEKDLTWAKYTASIVFELVLGLAGGFVCGVVGAVAIGLIYKIKEPSFGDIIGALLGFAIVYAITMPLCVYLTGRYIFKRRSSVWMCILASVCGVTAVLALAEPLRLNVIPHVLTTSFLIVPLILSVAVFNYYVRTSALHKKSRFPPRPRGE